MNQQSSSDWVVSLNSNQSSANLHLKSVDKNVKKLINYNEDLQENITIHTRDLSYVSEQLSQANSTVTELEEQLEIHKEYQEYYSKRKIQLSSELSQFKNAMKECKKMLLGHQIGQRDLTYQLKQLGNYSNTRLNPTKIDKDVQPQYFVEQFKELSEWLEQRNCAIKTDLITLGEIHQTKQIRKLKQQTALFQFSQAIFQFLETTEQVKLQLLNKRFYEELTPAWFFTITLQENNKKCSKCQLRTPVLGKRKKSVQIGHYRNDYGLHRNDYIFQIGNAMFNGQLNEDLCQECNSRTSYIRHFKDNFGRTANMSRLGLMPSILQAFYLPEVERIDQVELNEINPQPQNQQQQPLRHRERQRERNFQRMLQFGHLDAAVERGAAENDIEHLAYQREMFEFQLAFRDGEIFEQQRNNQFFF